MSSAQVWSRKADFPTSSGGARFPASFSIPSLGKGYCIGGNNNQAWEYDTLAGAWTQLMNFQGQSSGTMVGCSINGMGYLATGTAGGYYWDSTAWEYDPGLNQWNKLPHFPGPPRGYATGFSIGGKFYVGGGLGTPIGNGSPTYTYHDFYAYDPSTRTWTKITDCPAKGCTLAAVGFSIGNNGYVGTGSKVDSNSTSPSYLPQKDFWTYDPSADKWTSIADFGGGNREGAAAFAFCSSAYVGLGANDPGQSNFTTDFWQYDPAKDKWTQTVDFPGLARAFTNRFVINKSAFVGMGDASPSYFDFYEFNFTTTPSITTAGSSSTTICTGQTVSFTDTSNYAPTNWLWQFPGGNPRTSASQNPTVEYDTAGIYNVILSAWNACDSGGKVFSNYVTVGGGTTLTISPATPTVCPGQTVTLSVNGGGSSFKWSPGTALDKTTGDSVVATGFSQLDSIVYTIRDTSSSGCPAIGHVTLRSGGSAVAGIVSAIRDTICQGTPGNLSLTGNSSNTIQWQSSTDNATFTNAVGDTLVKYKTNPLLQTTWYRVTVGSGTCSAVSNTQQLYVPPALTAYFSATQTAGKRLSFNSDSSIGNIRSYHWDFGDGQTSSEKDPSHSYTKDTTYYVCLTLYDGSNCSYTFCRYSDVTDAIPVVSALGNWVVYPNPFSSELNIKAKQANDRLESLGLYDVLGRQMLNFITNEINNPELKLNVSTLSNGVYFLKIKTAGANYVQKIVKQ